MRGYEDTSGEEEGGNGFSPGDLIVIARRRWIQILTLAILPTCLVGAYSLTLPNSYEAVTTIQIDPRARKIVEVEGVLADVKADTATIESEVEILHSLGIAQRVVAMLDLRRDAEFQGLSVLDTWRHRLGLARPPAMATPEPLQDGTHRPRAGAEPERDDVAMALAARVRALRVRNTWVIEVRFSSADPSKAARIANAIGEVYLRSQVETKIAAAEAATELLEDRNRSLREKVAEAERAVERFKARHDIFDADGSLLVDRQLQREMEALLAARARTAEAKARYEQARRMMLGGEGNEAVADVLQSHTVRLLKDELTKALRRQAELATRYGPRHPEFQKVAADVGKAQAELSAEISKIIKNLRTEFDVAAEREQHLAGALADLKEQISASKAEQAELRELEREAAASKQLYEALLARTKQTGQTIGLQLPDARIVEPASVPSEPTAPRRKRMVLITFAGGLAIGLGLALLVELAGPGLARLEDIEAILRQQHLASLPALDVPDGDSKDPFSSTRLMLSVPHCAFAEAIRGLRHEIDMRPPHAAHRAILLASSLPNEGKSLIASNLAHHYALTGARTLLVDADLRRRTLTRDLGVRMRPGLLDVVLGRIPLEEAILRDQLSGLHFLPAASELHRRHNAAEVLASSEAAAIIRDLRRRFEVIVLDAPPLLPVVDTRVLAGLVDQIALVTLWKKTPKTLIRRAIRTLGADAEKIVGVVVNRVDRLDDAASFDYARHRDEEPLAA